MGVPAPPTNSIALSVTLTETQRKDAIDSAQETCRDARELEDWLEAQPQRFAMLGINADSYTVVMRVASHLYGLLNNWWLNRKQRASISFFRLSRGRISQDSMLPNILDYAINAILGLTQGILSYASYTQLFNDILRRSRKPLTDDVQCVRFIKGLANFQLQT
jgi:hypothetical protein